jgi:hypothetical protein
MIARPFYVQAINDCSCLPIQGDTFQEKLCVDTLFPARESLVSDIPTGTGKSLTFFYSVQLVFNIVICPPTAAFLSFHFQKSLWVNFLVSLLFSSFTPPFPLHSTLFCLSVSDIFIPPYPQTHNNYLTVSASSTLVYIFICHQLHGTNN